MARANYIYIVKGSVSGVLGAFTVKYELIRWIKRINYNGLTIVRLRDGVPGTAVYFDAEEYVKQNDRD
jgi:hypothetical protein